MSAANAFTIYTDGGCLKNDGSDKCTGAYAFIIIDANNNVVCKSSEVVEKTTNNRMELGAAIAGIKALKKLNPDLKETSCVVVTDSQYMSKGYGEYMPEWIRRGWRKSDGGPVLNSDLWRIIKGFSPEFLSLTFKWVRGHADDRWNCECDAMVGRKLYGRRSRASAATTATQILNIGDPVLADVEIEKV